MQSTTINSGILEYFDQLNTDEQETILNLIKMFVDKRSNFAESITLEEYNNELDKADALIEAGDYVTHEEVKKRYLK